LLTMQGDLMQQSSLRSIKHLVEHQDLGFVKVAWVPGQYQKGVVSCGFNYGCHKGDGREYCSCSLRLPMDCCVIFHVALYICGSYDTPSPQTLSSWTPETAMWPSVNLQSLMPWSSCIGLAHIHIFRAYEPFHYSDSLNVYLCPPRPP
jgi:hypothetical protein